MQYQGRSQLIRSVSAILALAVGATGAYAQDSGETQVGGIEEVIVTARKRAESVQDVPVLVTAVSAEQIRERDLTSLDKVAAATPNLNVGRASNGSGAQITLRGIGTSSTSIGIEQSVAVIVDGVYYGQGRIIQEGFFDLDTLEVLKGPQALFFGKNATAGVINMKTADPGSEPEFLARAGYEFKAQQAQLELVGSMPVSDTLGVRVAVRGSKMYDGYYKNVMPTLTNYNTFDIATGSLNSHTALPASRNAPGEKEILGRVTLKWTPNDSLTGTLKAALDHNDVNNSSWNYVCWKSPTGISQLSPNGLNDPNNFACDNDKFVTHQSNFPLDIAANFPNARKDGREYNRYRSYSITGNLEWDTDTLNVTWVNNWNRNTNRWACNCDFQASPITVFATESSSFRAISSELRGLTKFEGPVNALLGVYWQDTKRDFEQNIAFANLEDSSQSAANRYQATSKIGDTDGKTVSVFGQAIWSITQAVEATAGVRYTHETKDSFFTQPYNNAGVTFIFRPSTDPLGIVTAKQTFKNWSPEFTLSWKPIDDVMLYAAYKSGYKSGGFSISGINSGFSQNPLADLVFEPEKARGFEAGVKSTLADNQVRLNATVYRYKYKDLQVDFFRSDIFAFNTVTADARTTGFELESEFAPAAAPGLLLNATIAYNRAKYIDSALPCFAGQGPLSGCTLSVGGVPYQDVSGNPTAMAPKWAGAVGARYEMDVGGSYKFAINGNARYSGKYLASGFGNPLSKVGSYVVFDAGVKLGSDDDRWEVALIGRNLTNELYISGVVDGPSTGGTAGTDGRLADQMGFGVVPRTVMVQLTTRF